MDTKEKITIELVEETLSGEKLKKFLEICLNSSDSISLSSRDTTQMLKEEVRQAKQTFNDYLEQNGRRRWDEDEEEYEKHSIPYAESKQKIEEWAKQYMEPYQMIRREVTCMAEYTYGPPQVIYSFESNGPIKQKMECLENIFDCILLEAQTSLQLEDPVFYKQGKVIGAICSHEGMGKFEFELSQYEAFRKLRIPHEVRSPIKELTLEEWLEECAYQERETLTIHGWRQSTLPKELGQIKTLKQLEVFDHEVSYLPQSLEQLTRLECLRITGNQVKNLGFDISKLQNLKILDLGGMPLQTFPTGILELKQLEKIYLGDAKFEKVPEGIMNLKSLQVLSLPPIKENKLSPELKDFIEKLSPYSSGISLRDILGEEKWQEILEQGDYIIRNE